MTTNTISTDKKIVTSFELNEMGFSAYKIRNMVAQGQLIRLNKSTYENVNYAGEDSDYIYVYAYVPDGVICLLSAASIYGLTTYRPDSIDVAVNQKRNVSTVPDWPTMKFWYFENTRLESGISEIVFCNQKMKIYDIEKTVADIIYYRNKLGIEETKEVLINYLNCSDRNINRLCRYAQKLRCKEILDTYLEVLI
ncbi:MAG TPA: type IV toxin-antitoxin system AbiEi family antitoxin domain-containing protein [Lachnospiraceae bacterium]|nr:type IV toxin-antitoxin system AbiEi family antitoxin domain-containing protein [Lachnospiraceae bacterium]